MTGALRETAPAKLNLCLFLGPVRPTDGRHELVTVFRPLTLADDVELEPAGLGARGDAVSCPGVPGAAEQNLAAAALRAFRQRTGWAGPPVRLRITKRIPVAAGMAGGSADAAAGPRDPRPRDRVRDRDVRAGTGVAARAGLAAHAQPARRLAPRARDQLAPVGRAGERH